VRAVTGVAVVGQDRLDVADEVHGRLGRPWRLALGRDRPPEGREEKQYPQAAESSRHRSTLSTRQPATAHRPPRQSIWPDDGRAAANVDYKEIVSIPRGKTRRLTPNCPGNLASCSHSPSSKRLEQVSIRKRSVAWFRRRRIDPLSDIQVRSLGSKTTCCG